MTISIVQLLSFSGGIVIFFTGIIMFLLKQQKTRDEKSVQDMQKRQADHNNILWKRIDDIKQQHTDLEKELTHNYRNKADTKEYMELNQKPLFDKLDHFNDSLSQVKGMLELLVSNNIGGERPAHSK